MIDADEAKRLSDIKYKEVKKMTIKRLTPIFEVFESRILDATKNGEYSTVYGIIDDISLEDIRFIHKYLLDYGYSVSVKNTESVVYFYVWWK